MSPSNLTKFMTTDATLSLGRSKKRNKRYQALVQDEGALSSMRKALTLRI